MLMARSHLVVRLLGCCTQILLRVLYVGSRVNLPNPGHITNFTAKFIPLAHPTFTGMQPYFCIKLVLTNYE